MRVGLVILPTDRWATARGLWKWAEDAGFATAWTYDHIVWGGFPSGPWHAAYPVLAAAASVTDRIRLGTLVTSPNFRHPVSLARQVITLDDVSSGRFELGIGAGSGGPDAAVLGTPVWSPAERSARFAEFLELLDRLLTQPLTTSNGRFYSAVAASMTPACVQQPRVPFTIAAAGPRSLRLVARLGQRWVTIGPAGSGPRQPDDVYRAVALQAEQLIDACEEVGRNPSSVGRVLLLTTTTGPDVPSLGAFDEMVGRYGDLGFDEIVLHHPRQTGPYAGDMAVLEAIAERYGSG
ncbi:MAG TPA: LLM class flavin-dependent oxidoreductase [Acidimicrobiales bacterium]|nr:LLM class flavin-dependent oxidoreductase [Acidimicrobiales bacterium]